MVIYPKWGHPRQNKKKTVTEKESSSEEEEDKVVEASKMLIASEMLRDMPLSVQSWDEWMVVKDIVECHVDFDDLPCGVFWNHIKQYMFDRAGSYFAWLKQKQEKKASFLKKLRETYRGWSLVAG